MCRVSIIIILLFSFVGHSLAQNKDETKESDVYEFSWTPTYKLQWSDFKGVNDTTDLAFRDKLAVCATNINVKAYRDSGMIKFLVTNSFYPYDSWVVDSTLMGKSGLEHEQLHFDITELYTRKIRKGIDEISAEREVSMEDYSRIVNSLLNEFDKRNTSFDKETSHGVYKSIQEKWREEIWMELEALSEYEEINNR